VASGAVWEPPVPAELRDRARAAACLIAERLERPQVVRASAAAMLVQKRAPVGAGALSPWQLAWLAELFLWLARSVDERGWEEPAHRYLRMAAEESQELPVDRPGLLGGTGGLALVVESFFREEPRYQKARQALHEQVAEQVLARRWRRPGPGVDVEDYDLVLGASGILGCLVSLDAPAAAVDKAIETLLGYLVWLAVVDTPGQERWFVPPRYFNHERRHRSTPHGYVDLGLAHGLAGPLAALSLAWQAGYRIDGHREAIERLSRWLLAQRLTDPWGPYWPEEIPYDFATRASGPPQQGDEVSLSRPSWCYGEPGVATALWLAGSALEAEGPCRTAVASLEGVFRRPFADPRNPYQLCSPTLCHGVGGLLAISLRFAALSGSEVIGAQIPGLVGNILDACDPDLPLGVQDQEVPGNFVDDPGFLTGAAGVALVLLAASTSTPPSWDRTLLIA
jgi:lantibiotic biosynthesis protein